MSSMPPEEAVVKNSTESQVVEVGLPFLTTETEFMQKDPLTLSGQAQLVAEGVGLAGREKL